MSRGKPVAAYPEEYTTLFMKAADAPVEFSIAYGMAVHYRHQLYALRVSMRKEKHIALPRAENVSIRIIPEKAEKDTLVTLRLEPKSNNPFAVLIRETVGDVTVEEMEESTFSGATTSHTGGPHDPAEESNLQDPAGATSEDFDFSNFLEFDEDDEDESL